MSGCGGKAPTITAEAKAWIKDLSLPPTAKRRQAFPIGQQFRARSTRIAGSDRERLTSFSPAPGRPALHETGFRPLRVSHMIVPLSA
jgi:hypothetical protein